MSSEPIDIEKYHRDYIDTLSEEERQAIRQSHVERIKQGREVWNAWAKQVLAAIEQTYPKNATEAEKLTIRNQYEIDFSWVEFEGLVNFSGFIFPIAVNFTKASFSGEADFEWATFSDMAIFWETTFSGEAYFSEVTFSGKADFSEATFSDRANFNKATFSGEAYFNEATFPGKAYFRNTSFSDDADFGWATFSERAVFGDAIFSDEADFGWTTFSNEANFRKTTFSDKANFRKITFSDKADFSETTFSGKAYFGQVIFSNMADFSEAAFSGEEVAFLGTQFQQQSLFIDLQFSKAAKATPCDFRQTHFYLPPSVDDFPSDISQFINANKNIKRDKEFYKACEAKFRTLKQLAERNNHHQKTLEFYGCELYCQRQASGGWRKPKNWVSYFYGLLSGYGLSLLRPFILWLVVMCIGIGAQALNDGKTSFSFTTAGWERASFYIAPSMPPFVGKPLYQKEVRHRLYPADQTKPAGQLPTANRFIRTIQTLMTFIALFLFGLALRNRFKIG
ncbi:MAG: hypothetical protein CR975_05970 [Gammaproteobacteria bacterium]|nr:MAG: hypothetical protein CR975_05970 [Gammaproteobacteria bacterium]